MIKESLFSMFDNNMDNFPILDSRYIIITELADGRHGRVFLGFDNWKKEFIAIKILKRPNSVSALDAFLKEISILVKILNFEFQSSFVQILDFNFTGKTNLGTPIVYYIMEFIELGELFGLLSTDLRISEGLSCYFLLQIVGGLDELHSKGIFHLDLKPENILLKSSGKLVFCDFGNSIIEESQNKMDYPEKEELTYSFKKFENKLRKMNYKATLPYISPELNKILKVISTYNHSFFIETIPKEMDPFKIESFSVGVVLFTIYFKSLPFESCDSCDPFFRKFENSRNQFWQIFERTRKIESDLKVLFEDLLEPNPIKRISLTLNHLSCQAWVRRVLPSFCFDNNNNLRLVDFSLDSELKEELKGFCEKANQQFINSLKIKHKNNDLIDPSIFEQTKVDNRLEIFLSKYTKRIEKNISELKSNLTQSVLLQTIPSCSLSSLSIDSDQSVE